MTEAEYDDFDGLTYLYVVHRPEEQDPNPFQSPPPPPIPSPPVTPPPSRPAPPRPRKLRRIPLPPGWAKLGAKDHQDALTDVLEHLWIKSIPRPLSKPELRQAWDALAARARELGREPLMIYRGTSGRELVRMRKWLGYRIRDDANRYEIAVTSAMPLTAAVHRLRFAAMHPPHLARLRGNRLAPYC